MHFFVKIFYIQTPGIPECAQERTCKSEYHVTAFLTCPAIAARPYGQDYRVVGQSGCQMVTLKPFKPKRDPKCFGVLMWLLVICSLTYLSKNMLFVVITLYSFFDQSNFNHHNYNKLSALNIVPA